MAGNGIKKSKRCAEILQDFLVLIDSHFEDIHSGKATRLKRIREFASQLFIHPTHFSDSVKQISGMSPWHIYENRIIAEAKKMLRNQDIPILAVSDRLCFTDPTNFTKFFKLRTGITPREYRLDVGRVKAPDQVNHCSIPKSAWTCSSDLPFVYGNALLFICSASPISSPSTPRM